MIGAEIVCTADEVVAWVRILGETEVTEATVRSWAQRGHIGRHGARNGRTLYNVAEVQGYLASRLAETEDRMQHSE